MELPLLIPITFDRPCNCGESTLSVLSKYFYLTGAMGHVAQGNEVQFVENEAPSWVMFALKVASYVLLLPITFFLFVTRLVLGCQYRFKLQAPAPPPLPQIQEEPQKPQFDKWAEDTKRNRYLAGNGERIIVAKKEDGQFIPVEEDPAPVLANIFRELASCLAANQLLKRTLKFVNCDVFVQHLLNDDIGLIVSSGKFECLLSVIKDEHLQVNLLQKKTNQGETLFDILIKDFSSKTLTVLLEIEPRFLERQQNEGSLLVQLVTKGYVESAKIIQTAMDSQGIALNRREKMFMKIASETEITEEELRQLDKKDQVEIHDCANFAHNKQFADIRSWLIKQRAKEVSVKLSVSDLEMIQTMMNNGISGVSIMQSISYGGQMLMMSNFIFCPDLGTNRGINIFAQILDLAKKSGRIGTPSIIAPTSRAPHSSLFSSSRS